MQQNSLEEVKNLTKAVMHIEAATKLLKAISNPQLEHINSLLTEAYGLAREELAASEI